MKGSHRKCEEAPKKYDEKRRASSSFGMLNGANAAYGKGIRKAPPLKRFKGGTVILCGDKGMDAPHLVRLCGALCGGVHFQGLLRPFGARAAASGGANRQRRTLLAECVHFQGLLRPFGAHAAASGGANRQRRTLLAECVHFQGLLRPLGARAAASGGANRHPRITLRSPLLYRSDVVLVQSKYKEKRDARMHLIFLGALSGTRTLGPLIKSQLLYQLS